MFKFMLLGTILFISACSHKQVKVEKKSIEPNFANTDVNTSTSINLTELSSTTIPNTEIKKIWIPLKIEDEIEWNAKELLGKKYVWGATGPHTYDCSGFTQKIYDDLGIKIPRVSRHQATVGELVYFSDLQKGDMVFFETNKKRPGRVTHVGIYLGNGDFIHASSTAKEIVICNFDKDCFYKETFLWGRRVLQLKEHLAFK